MIFLPLSLERTPLSATVTLRRPNRKCRRSFFSVVSLSLSLVLLISSDNTLTVKKSSSGEKLTCISLSLTYSEINRVGDFTSIIFIFFIVIMIPRIDTCFLTT